MNAIPSTTATLVAVDLITSECPGASRLQSTPPRLAITI